VVLAEHVEAAVAARPPVQRHKVIHSAYDGDKLREKVDVKVHIYGAGVTGTARCPLA